MSWMCPSSYSSLKFLVSPVSYTISSSPLLLTVHSSRPVAPEAIRTTVSPPGHLHTYKNEALNIARVCPTSTDPDPSVRQPTHRPLALGFCMIFHKTRCIIHLCSRYAPNLGVPISYPIHADPLEAATLRWNRQRVSVIPETMSTGRHCGAFPLSSLTYS